MRAAIIAALLGCALLALAADGARAACVTPDTVSRTVEIDDPDATVERIEGKRAENLAAGIERLTGTDAPPDALFLAVTSPHSSLVYVVMFVEGCASRHGNFVPRVFEVLVDGQAS